MDKPENERIASALDELKERRSSLISKRGNRQRSFFLMVSMAVLMPIISTVFFFSFKDKSTIRKTLIPVLTLYSLTPIAMIPLTRVRIRQTEEEMQDIEFEIDLQKFDASPQEYRAEKLIRISNIQLRRYYDLNLNQNIWIFGVGIFCILLGIGIIILTLFLLLKFTDQTDTKIIIGAIGAIGSFLVNYVAAIYLKMHANAAANLGLFHSRLVETHQLLLSNLLASHIEDDNKRWETISQISTCIVKSNKD